GTLLTPLNSSMMAVALVRMQHDFAVTVATATWLISGFYLASAVAQPLTGRLADRFGPRRVFLTGLLLLLGVSTVAPLAPGFGWLAGARALQALGASVAFPAGLAMIRASSPSGQMPAGSLAAVNIANSTSAAFGPTLAGFLIAFAGWQAIFLVNLPIAGLALLTGVRWLPRDRPAPSVGRDVLREVDLIGLLLFAATIGGLLALLVQAGRDLPWPLLGLPLLTGIVLVLWERRAPTPFLDVRMLAANPRLAGVYLQFAGVNVVFYSIFLALPLWLQQVRGLPPHGAGLLLLPITVVSILVTPLAAASIARSGPRPALVLGTIALLAGSLPLLLFGPATPLWALAAAEAVVGVQNGLNTLALQAALYESAPAAVIGTASGLFQTCRYVGAILSTVVIGAVFGSGTSTAGLHAMAALLVVLSACLVVASAATRTRAAPSV
ncbi:MAG TPA: MFS transporter, partial [Candidatus Dormibacteraeota bacterium]